MASVEAIPIPLPHVGSVNAWLVRGEPLTLVDTGPRSDQALDALERGLAVRGHGVPPGLFEPVEALCDYTGATAERFDTDVRLQDGDRIQAGGRELSAVARPGHSATDTLLVDAAGRLAFGGDHLLAKISPNTEIYRLAAAARSRSRSRVDYLTGLKRTARMPLRRLLPGHGPAISSPRDIVRRELAQHRLRCQRIIRALEHGPASAFAIGRELWPDAIVRQQPLLVVWEVLGHLDLMLMAGVATEGVDDDGRWLYSLARIGMHHDLGRDFVQTC